MSEQVNILKPPKFNVSDIIKDRDQAIRDGDWIGTFNLWILSTKPKPSLIYQIRSPRKEWAPDKMDVTVGGHYRAGEGLNGGLREIKEELGITYNPDNFTFIGRKMHVSPDIKGFMRRNIVDIYFIIDNRSLEQYRLDQEEVYALCKCPLDNLIKVHEIEDYNFKIPILLSNGHLSEKKVEPKSFPYNWDNYHYKIALLAQRFLTGDKDLIY